MKTLIENLRDDVNTDTVDELVWENGQVIDLLESVDQFLVQHRIPSAMTVLQQAIERLKK
jgi:hypothetical protein